MVNKIGPRTEPCGTPKGKLCQDEVLALIFHIFLVKIQSLRTSFREEIKKNKKVWNCMELALRKSTFLNEVF